MHDDELWVTAEKRARAAEHLKALALKFPELNIDSFVLFFDHLHVVLGIERGQDIRRIENEISKHLALLGNPFQRWPLYFPPAVRHKALIGPVAIEEARQYLWVNAAKHQVSSDAFVMGGMGRQAEPVLQT